MKKHQLRNMFIKTAIALTMMISAAWLSGCSRQQAEMEQKVVHVSEYGNDETGTGTWYAPYATISHAAETEPGSLILVGGGEYEPFELGPGCSGSEDSPTVIRPAEGAKVVIPVEDEAGIFLKNVQNISVEGLETVGGVYAIEYLSTPEAGQQILSNISIRNCRVHDVRGEHGICVYARNDLAPVTNLTIEGCEVYDCECHWSESMVINGNVDGGQNIEIYNNFIFNCDIGVEVATEHSPDDNELFKVSGINVHDNVIADCTGWAGIVFGGYDKDLGFTEDCVFDYNTLIDNVYQIVVQRSQNNRVCSNLILGGEEGIHFEYLVWGDSLVNEISGNAASGIMNEESWSEVFGTVYPDRSETKDGFRSLVEDTGSRFVPDKEMTAVYKAQITRKRWNNLKERVKSWFDRYFGEPEEENAEEENAAEENVEEENAEEE